MGTWQPDPAGRHEYRWEDNGQWTEHVADQGQQSVDPMPAPPVAPQPPTPVMPEAPTPVMPGAPQPDAQPSASSFGGTVDEAGSSAAEDEAPAAVFEEPAVADEPAPEPAPPQMSQPASQAPERPQPDPPAPSARQPAAPQPPTPVGSAAAENISHPSPGSTGISGGVMGDGYDEEDVDRVGLQNSKLLKIRLGDPVYIKRGAMVAYQGEMTFEAISEGGGLGSMLKRAVSDNALMAKAQGRGDLFVADDADEIHMLELAGGSLLVNGPNLLAFENTVAFETVRFKGAGLASGGGLFGMKLSGSGWVAVTCHGTPVRLDTDGSTYVDAQSAVAWSGDVPMSVNVQKMSFGSMRSGELMQLQFGPGGFVLVQASEGPTVPTHSHS